MKQNFSVIFDLDGTLIHSTQTIRTNVNKVMMAYDCEPLSLNIINSFVGNGPRVLISKVVKYHQSRGEIITDNVDDLTEIFSHHYNQNPYDDTVIYDGAIELLQKLKSSNIPMVICTNKVTDTTLLLLQYFKLAEYFEFIIGGDQVSERKPNPEGLIRCVAKLPTDCHLFVGDSEVDAKTAENAKLPFFLYQGGYLNAPLSEIKYTKKFSDFEKLYQLLVEH